MFTLLSFPDLYSQLNTVYKNTEASFRQRKKQDRKKYHFYKSVINGTFLRKCQYFQQWRGRIIAFSALKLLLKLVIFRTENFSQLLELNI